MNETVIELCEAVVAKIAARWQPTSPSAVTFTHTPGVVIKELEGRQIQVGFEEWGQEDIADKLHDVNYFVIVVDVFEVYGEQGDPTNAWVNERVNFVGDLWRMLSNPRVPPLFPSPLNDVYPRSTARGRQGITREWLDEDKLFGMQIVIVYERHEAFSE